MAGIIIIKLLLLKVLLPTGTGGRVTLTGIFLGKTKDQTKAAFAAAGLFAALGHPNKDVKP